MKYIKLKIAEYLLENSEMYKNVQYEYRKKNLNLSDSEIFSKSSSIQKEWDKAEEYFENYSLDDFYKNFYQDDILSTEKIIDYINDNLDIDDITGKLSFYISQKYNFYKKDEITKSIQDNIYNILDENDIDYDDVYVAAEKYIDYIKDSEDIEDDEVFEKLNDNLEMFDLITLFGGDLWKDIVYFDEYTQELYNEIEKENDMDSDRIKIYRALDIPENDNEMVKHIEQYNNVGVYWGCDKEHAIVYTNLHDTNSYNIILEAEVDVINVNWNDVIALNFSMFSQEKEIRLYENKPVKISKIHFESNEKTIDTEIVIYS